VQIAQAGGQQFGQRAQPVAAERLLVKPQFRDLSRDWAGEQPPHMVGGDSHD